MIRSVFDLLPAEFFVKPGQTCRGDVNTEDRKAEPEALYGPLVWGGTGRALKRAAERTDLIKPCKKNKTIKAH